MRPARRRVPYGPRQPVRSTGTTNAEIGLEEAAGTIQSITVCSSLWQAAGHSAGNIATPLCTLAALARSKRARVQLALWSGHGACTGRYALHGADEGECTLTPYWPYLPAGSKSTSINHSSVRRSMVNFGGRFLTSTNAESLCRTSLTSRLGPPARVHSGGKANTI